MSTVTLNNKYFEISSRLSLHGSKLRSLVFSRLDYHAYTITENRLEISLDDWAAICDDSQVPLSALKIAARELSLPTETFYGSSIKYRYVENYYFENNQLFLLLDRHFFDEYFR